MNVSGISLSLKLVNEAKRINANTTPLAPISAEFGNRIKCAIPVISAVIAMVHTRVFPPYRSSSMGPRISMVMRLPVRWDIELCPNIWQKNLKYVRGLAIEERYTENKAALVLLCVSSPSTNATTHMAVNVSMTGEFNTILYLELLLLPDLDVAIFTSYSQFCYMIIFNFSGNTEKVT